MNSLFLKKSAPIAALSAMILLTGGCATEGEMLRDEGYPVGYTEGYDDGCSSGKKAAGGYTPFRKDVHRFQDDRDYHDGWNDGHKECERQFEATQHEIERAEDQYEREQRQDW